MKPHIVIFGRVGECSDADFRRLGFIVNFSQICGDNYAAVVSLPPRLFLRLALELCASVKGPLYYTDGEISRVVQHSLSIIKENTIVKKVFLGSDDIAMVLESLSRGDISARHKNLDDFLCCYFGTYLSIIICWDKFLQIHLQFLAVFGLITSACSLILSSAQWIYYPNICLVLYSIILTQLWARRCKALLFAWGVHSIKRYDSITAPIQSLETNTTVRNILIHLTGVPLLLILIYAQWTIRQYMNAASLWLLLLSSTTPAMSCLAVQAIFHRIFRIHELSSSAGNMEVNVPFAFVLCSHFADVIYRIASATPETYPFIRTSILLQFVVSVVLHNYELLSSLLFPSVSNRLNDDADEPSTCPESQGGSGSGSRRSTPRASALSWFIPMNKRYWAERLEREKLLPDIHIYAKYSWGLLLYGYVVVFGAFVPLLMPLAFVVSYLLSKHSIRALSMFRRPVIEHRNAFGDWFPYLMAINAMGAFVNGYLLFVSSSSSALVHLLLPLPYQQMVDGDGSSSKRWLLFAIFENFVLLFYFIMLAVLPSIPSWIREARAAERARHHSSHVDSLLLGQSQMEGKRPFRSRLQRLREQEKAYLELRRAAVRILQQRRQKGLTSRQMSPFALLPSVVMGQVLGSAGCWSGWSLPLSVALFAVCRARRESEDRAVALGVLGSRSNLEALYGSLPLWRKCDSYDMHDYEHSAYANDVLQRLWTRLAGFLENKFIASAQPILNKVKPSVMSVCHIDKVDIGSYAPRITAIAVYPARDDKSLFIDLDFSYSGDGKIFFRVETVHGNVPVLVDSPIFSGSVRLNLNPLVTAMPPFSAVGLSFLKPPVVNFRVKVGSWLRATQIGLRRCNVGSMLSRMMREAICDLCLFPNKTLIEIGSAEEDYAWMELDDDLSELSHPLTDTHPSEVAAEEEEEDKFLVESALGDDDDAPTLSGFQNEVRVRSVTNRPFHHLTGSRSSSTQSQYLPSCDEETPRSQSTGERSPQFSLPKAWSERSSLSESSSKSAQKSDELNGKPNRMKRLSKGFTKRFKKLISTEENN